MSAVHLNLCLPKFGLIAAGIPATPSTSGATLPQDDLELPRWQPPADLAHLHRPDFVASVLRRVLDAVRQPIEPVQFQGQPAWLLLGVAVLHGTRDGWWGGLLWYPRGDEMRLLHIPEDDLSVYPCPAGLVWLDAVMAAVGLELRQRLDNEPIDDIGVHRYLAALQRWLSNHLRRHTDLRAMRHKVQRVLALDPVTLQYARHLHREVERNDRAVSARAWNQAVRHRRALDVIAHEAPALLPLYGALLDGRRLPAHLPQDAVATLRQHLARAGIRPALWRLLLRSPARLPLVVRQAYEGPIGPAVIEFLQILQDFGLRDTPDVDLLRAIWARDGNDSYRWSSYRAQVQPYAEAYGHVARCFGREKARTPAAEQPALRQAMYRVVAWINLDKVRALPKNGRRAGWPWLVRQAEAAEGLRAATASLTRRWPVPSPVDLGDFRVVPLGSELALWEEGRAMHHCAHDRSGLCIPGDAMLVSIRRSLADGSHRRMATAQYERKDGAWALTMVLGPTNKSVGDAVRQGAERVAVWLNSGEAVATADQRAISSADLTWFTCDDRTLTMDGVETEYGMPDDDANATAEQLGLGCRFKVPGGSSSC